MKEQNTKNDNNIDVLTTLNMVKYISYYFYLPEPITEKIRMYHFFSKKDEFTITEFRRTLNMKSKHAYPDLKKMVEDGIVEKIGKEKYKVINHEKVAEIMEPILNNIQKNIENVPQELITAIYKSMALLYISNTGNKTPQTFSDLLFYMQIIYTTFCVKIIPSGKKQLTRTLILYYLDVFGALKTRKLHRVIPAATSQNIFSTSKIMSKDGLVKVENPKPKTAVQIEITKKGKKYLEENKKNADKALEALADSAVSSEFFILALQGLAEAGSELLQYNNIENKA